MDICTIIKLNATHMNRLKDLSKDWYNEGITNRLKEAALLCLIILSGIMVSNILGG